MLRFILADTTMFGSEDDVERTRKDLCWFLEALTQRNTDYLKARPKTPRLYRSGVRYQLPEQMNGECKEARVLREALGKNAKQRDVAATLDLVQEVFGGERFRDIGRIIDNRGGDCDNLACWRAAELRVAGINAKPYMTHRERSILSGGGTVYHALVLWPPFGSIKYVTSEDPSLLLGMGGPGRVNDRAEEIRKNQERCDILRAMKGGTNRFTPDTSDIESAISDVLGLRTGQRVDEAQAIDDILRRVA